MFASQSKAVSHNSLVYREVAEDNYWLYRQFTGLGVRFDGLREESDDPLLVIPVAGRLFKGATHNGVVNSEGHRAIIPLQQRSSDQVPHRLHRAFLLLHPEFLQGAFGPQSGNILPSLMTHLPP